MSIIRIGDFGGKFILTPLEMGIFPYYKAFRIS